MSCERVVATDDLLKEGSVHTLLVNRSMVDGVIEAPGGARFTSNPPDYQRDEELQKKYASTPWAEFAEEFLA